MPVYICEDDVTRHLKINTPMALTDKLLDACCELSCREITSESTMGSTKDDIARAQVPATIRVEPRPSGRPLRPTPHLRTCEAPYRKAEVRRLGAPAEEIGAKAQEDKMKIATNEELIEQFGYPRVSHGLIGEENRDSDGPYPEMDYAEPGRWATSHYDEAVRRLSPSDTDKALILLRARIDADMRRAREDGLGSAWIERITNIIPNAVELAVEQIESSGLIAQVLDEDGDAAEIRIAQPFEDYLVTILASQFKCNYSLTAEHVADLAQHPDPHSVVEYLLMSHGWRDRVFNSRDSWASLLRYWPTLCKQWAKKGSEVHTGFSRLHRHDEWDSTEVGPLEPATV
jgi:hypothetical protein